MSTVATFSATRAGWVKPCGQSVTPKPRRMFSVIWRQRAEDDLGRRRVRAALAEVVLDQPDRVEAELVGELDLLERLLVGPLLGLALAVRVGLARPGLGDVDLVEQVELHLQSFRYGKQLEETANTLGERCGFRQGGRKVSTCAAGSCC